MPLPSIVVDLDLTLSDSRWREHIRRNTYAGQHRSESERWDEFHRHAGADDPIDSILYLVVALQKIYDVLVLTSRPQSSETATLSWLSAMGVRPVLVLMRNDDDDSTPADLKRRQLAHARSLGYNPRLAIDDDEDVLEMYCGEGLEVLQPHLPDE